MTLVIDVAGGIMVGCVWMKIAHSKQVTWDVFADVFRLLHLEIGRRGGSSNPAPPSPPVEPTSLLLLHLLSTLQEERSS